MQVSDFYYALPDELIAQEALADRAASRMLVVSRSKQSFHDDSFQNLPSYLRSGDCVILNNTRVIPARLDGRRNHPSGAKIEVLLLRALDQEETTWNVVVKPGKRVRSGDRILFGTDLNAEVISQEEGGERTIRFSSNGAIGELLEQIGETPLPPYIHRKANAADRERYQTVFAQKKGSAAAPTAGLHFTWEMMERCRQAGAAIVYVTLHAGLGTFAPLREGNVADIRLHEEHFEIGEQAAERMRVASRRLCVGTTSVRAVESAMQRGGLSPMRGETNLFIYPGFQFHAADAMLTNFHLPQSSLLMLVSAFAGRELMLAAYQHAVRERYRFFSYGDCMLIE